MISRMSMLVLRIGLPVITCALTALTIRMRADVVCDPHKVLTTYPDMFAHIFAGLAFVVLGAMIFDIVEKGKKDKNK